MVETNITRRRVVQSAGAAGAAGVLGSTVVTAQQDNETGAEGADGDQAALRVAHASPDAPDVEVRLDDETEVDAVGFREVSDYSEVDPGSYQVQLVVTEGGLLGGIIDDIFGDGDDGDDGETVVFDEQVELEAGTTYTAVAFGELRRGQPTGGEPDDGVGTDNESDVGTDGGAVGEDNETGAGTDSDAGTDGDVGTDDDGVGTGADNETDGDVGETPAGGEQVVEGLAFGEHESFELDAGDYALGFREAAGGLADDTGTDVSTGDGNETGAGTGVGNDSDVGTDGGTVGEDNETGAGTDSDAGTDGDVGELGEDDADRGFQVEFLEDDLTDPGEDRTRLRVFHAVPDVDAVSVSAVEADDETVGDEDNDTDDTPGADDGPSSDNDTGAGDDGLGDETEDEGVQEVDISPEGETVYSGFAVGYFDPEEAVDEGNETDAGADNDTDGGLGGDNDTDGNETDDELGDPATEEFELVTVEDAQGGERSDGGTGGFLPF